MRFARVLKTLTIFAAALTAQTAGAQAVKLEPGTYEVSADASVPGGFDITGLMIEFTATTMTASQGGNLIVRANISLAGDVLTITDTEGPMMCTGTGKFKVTKSDKGFKLSPIEDACPERGQVLAAITLVKKA